MRDRAPHTRTSRAAAEPAPALPALELATDRPRPPALSPRRASVSRVLPPRLVRALDRMRRASSATRFVTLLSAYAALLYRYTGQGHLAIGVPWPRRGRRQGARAGEGPRHPLVVRARLDDELSFRALLAQVAAQIAAAEAHRPAHRGARPEGLGAAEDAGRLPLIQTTFELAPPGDGLPGAAAAADPAATRAPRPRAAAAVELSLSVAARGRGLVATLEYSTDLFDPETIERMLGHLSLLLAGVAEGAERPISEIPLLTPEERRRITVAWNATQTAYPRDACIHELFEAQAARTPDAIAAALGGEALTYRELDRRANRLARRLAARRAGPDLRVAVLVERSLRVLVALLGVLKAGGAYVPLDPSTPAERLRFMLEDAAASVLLGEPEQVARLAFCGEVLCLDDERGAPSDDERPAARVAATDLAYVMFTSGSTGRPKGVAVPHRGVVRLVRDTNYVAFGPSDRVAHASSLAFDASTFEIWGALLNGACLVLVSRETLLSPEAFPAFLRREGVTLLFLTTALFHQLARANPGAFQGLSTLVVGGDVLSPTLSGEVLEQSAPERLVNGYGPTENTTFSTAHVVRAVPEGAARVPIGRPVSNTRVYVLDRRLQPVPVGVPGELYVGGDGLALGYLNRPELTDEAFLPNPLPEEPGDRLYKTGDRARYLPDGSIEFLGRIDTQVKIRGFRVELGEIEAALAACPAVREAAVVAVEHAPGDRRLVAYVVAQAGPCPAPGSAAGPGQRSGTDRDGSRSRDRLSSTLRRFLQQKLPDCMIPAAFVALPSLPRSAGGKIDRRALPPPRPGRPGAVAPRTTGSPTERRVAGIWASVLGAGRVGAGDDFFELGGDSLLAAQVLLRVKAAFQVDVPARRLFESPTVAGLARAVDEARRRTGRGAVADAVDLRAEAVLDPDIRPCGEAALAGAAPRHVFVTGATGFLGAFLVRELLVQTRATVHCLVRARDAAHGLSRIRRALEAYSLWDHAARARIVAVPGDLTKPLLGLTPAGFDALAARIDAIYHAGAEVNYVKPYVSHRAANVLGTQEILRLACRGRTKPVHHVSTIGVFGHVGYFTGGRIVRERDDLDRWADYLHTDMGYSQSKWVAEKLVAIARSRGVPATVFRPGVIMGHSETGAGSVSDFASRMIKGCLEMGCAPDLPEQSKEFVTVDYVSRAIVHLARRPGALGKVFHLVPAPPQRLDLNGFFDLLGAYGRPLLRLPYARWCEALLKRIRRSGDSPLLPLLPMLTERVHGELTRWELYEKMPACDSRNALDGLAGTAIVCPPMDRRLLDRLFAYYARTGYLRAPAPPRSGVRRARRDERDGRMAQKPSRRSRRGVGG
ncbi:MULTISPECIES: non-ribosomal peptide synthetase [Sorangium]|uniref:non-ribosomal peptide synthetase n=1 Tax=Sorangium TaxID=39643 RepID=UPI0013EC3590|nr:MULTISPECIES: non-ribosomal peptide synthetase [Sorangium]